MSDLDWQKDSDYAYTERLSDREWAWEFLRRTEAYRSAWSEYIEIPVDDRTWKDSFNASAPFGLENPIDPDLLATKADIQLAWRQGVFLLEEDDYISRGPGDPWPNYPVMIPLWFYSNRPIEAQLTAAKRVLVQCQEKLAADGLPLQQKPDRRQSTRTRRLYLRLLDAEKSGATQEEMGNQLFRDASEPRDSARRMLKSARKLATTDYRVFLLRDPA